MHTIVAAGMDGQLDFIRVTLRTGLCSSHGADNTRVADIELVPVGGKGLQSIRLDLYVVRRSTIEQS